MLLSPCGRQGCYLTIEILLYSRDWKSFKLSNDPETPYLYTKQELKESFAIPEPHTCKQQYRKRPHRLRCKPPMWRNEELSACPYGVGSCPCCQLSYDRRGFFSSGFMKAARKSLAVLNQGLGSIRDVWGKDDNVEVADVRKSRIPRHLQANSDGIPNSVAESLLQVFPFYLRDISIRISNII